MNDLPRWNFPPTNGGIEVIQDAAIAHFGDDPLPKLVREVLQNSLDAKDNDLSGPVSVVFEESWFASEFVGAAELADHLSACRERAQKDGKPKLQEVYAKAVAAAQSDEIRCLRIIDSGTKGSVGANWNALVRQEGSVQKSGDNPGGSYGIGKNAVFNVSSLRTVFYSTRYLNLKEGGRVEKCQGKANLMAHELAWRATD